MTRMPDLVVVRDRGGQRQNTLQDTEYHSGWGASSVLFEVELFFEGLGDRLDHPHVISPSQTVPA